MEIKRKIVFIGSGNVSTVLGRRMLRKGHRVLQIYSRNKAHATELAEELQADAAAEVGDIRRDADLYIFAVSDDALREVARQLVLDGPLVVHTAGSVPSDILRTVSANYGCLYPIQSIRKETDGPEEIPLLIDANSDTNRQKLFTFASSISSLVQYAGDEQRGQLHLASVVVNNFGNYLFMLAEAFCRRQEVDFRILLPLITETANRLQKNAPATVQTGPAWRKDTQTISRHRALLAGDPVLLGFYDHFTQGIMAARDQLEPDKPYKQDSR